MTPKSLAEFIEELLIEQIQKENSDAMLSPVEMTYEVVKHLLSVAKEWCDANNPNFKDSEILTYEDGANGLYNRLESYINAKEGEKKDGD